MDRIVWQRIPVSHVATITSGACRLLAIYLVGCAFAVQRATNSLDKYLKFIASQDDKSTAEVRIDGDKHGLRFGACNA